jgi:predicted nuclease of restriction endonuclease-like (RecB) superfamily
MTSIIKQHSFTELIDNVYHTHCILQDNAFKAIDQNLTIRNWLIGYYIVEYEQKGEDRAQYGRKLLDEMAKSIKGKGIRGLDLRTLRSCRTFYSLYPQIWLTVSAKLELTALKSMHVLPKAGDVSIRGTLSPELRKDVMLPPEMLLSRLSFSHFLELIKVEDSLQRMFYEMEAIKNNWGVRELRRAIDSSLALRTTLSTNKEAIIAKIKKQKPQTNAEIIRNPYTLEFLDLEEKSEYSESDLEQAILDHLQQFLIELGTGFCFEARQKRITFGNRHYHIDLVFFHRILRCSVLIDLKIGEFTHADAGQMTLYLNYYEAEEMMEGENPPIGIILCADKNDALVEYATSKMDDQLFVSKYLLKLPNKKVLEDFIRKEMNE